MSLTLQCRACRDYATKFWLPVRWRQILERYDASIFERDGLVRNRNRRRNVGIVKRIVERIAEENEMTSVMKTRDANSEAEPRSPIWSVSVVRIISGAIRRVTLFGVNPRFGWTTAHFTVRLGRR